MKIDFDLEVSSMRDRLGQFWQLAADKGGPSGQGV